MNYHFEWDPKKAASNKKKHGINFEKATAVFKDENAISIFDEEHSDKEERWITIGLDPETKVLVVIHTYITLEQDAVKIRIISARKANKNEEKQYKGLS